MIMPNFKKTEKWKKIDHRQGLSWALIHITK